VKVHRYRYFKRTVLTLVMLPLLSGCWDRTEINDMAFVLSSAVDLEEDGQVRFSALVPLPGQMGGASGGGGGTGGEKSYYIDSEVGATLREAQGKLQRRMPRRMFLAHRRTMLIGEDYAKKGIKELFDSIPRNPESRMSAYMIVTKGPGYKMLQSTPKFERFPSEAMREMAKGPYIMNVNMKNVAVALSTPGSDPITAYMVIQDSQKSEKTSKEVDVLGYALFQEDKMVGTLESEAAHGLSWLLNQRVVAPVTLKIGDNQKVSTRIYDASSTVKVRMVGDKPSFDINVQAKAKVTENWSTMDLSQTNQIMKVEEALADYIRSSIEGVIAKSVKLKTDPGQLGAVLFRTYPAIWEKNYAGRWGDKLADAEFNIKVNAILAENGLIHGNVTKSGAEKQ
jgi:spore germination protein KC